MSLSEENQVLNDTKQTVNKLWHMHCKLDDDVQFKLNAGSGVDAIRELRAEVMGVSQKQRRALEEAVRSLNESKADRRELFIVQKKLASNGGACSACVCARVYMVAALLSTNYAGARAHPSPDHFFSCAPMSSSIR